MSLGEKEQVKRNFEQGAFTYDRYARVQKRMARELLSRIIATGKDFREILEIGCGTGFLTELLVREFPQAKVLAVDISPRMIEVAAKKLSAYPQISFLVGDGENLHIGGSFDLIVSSAVFQWFNDYLHPFAVYHRLLREEGYFIFNTLGRGTFEELAQALISLGKKFPGETFIDSGELGRILTACGFEGWQVEEQLLKDYYSSARELLVGIKKIGAQGRLFGAGGSYLRGEEVFKLTGLYNSCFREEKGVYATYRVLYGLARKFFSSPSRITQKIVEVE